MIIYEIALHLFALFSAPFILYKGFVKGRYKNSLGKRLGRGFPTIEKRGRKLIWVHAVSLGETRAVASLIAELKKRPENPLILLTTATETGFNEGKKLSVDYQAYLPFDFSYVIKPIVRRVRPDLVLLTETDFWYNFLSAVKKMGATLLLVNGKLSERSFKRHLKIPFFSRALFSLVDRFCVQGELYASRFHALHIPEEKVVVTGNIKLDGFTGWQENAEWRKRLCLEPGDRVLTCGSTHDPEEKIVVRELLPLLATHKDLKIVLVPRHPERFGEVFKLLKQGQIEFGQFSQPDSLRGKRVILMDVMGLLRQCYQLSYVAFVGGSLTPRVGGHNIVEPSFYGVPVLYGPYMQTQPDLVELVKKFGSGEEVSEGTLKGVVEKYLGDVPLREERGKRGRELVERNGGAMENTVREILLLVEKNRVW